MRNGRQGFVWCGAAALAGIFGILAFGGYPVCSQERAMTKTVSSETMSPGEKTGFYCNLKALSPDERLRHHALTLKLAGAKVETKELADGIAYRLADGSVSIAELGEWVTAERKCCPFFDFEIEAERDGGPLWLKLRGREGVKAFIHAEFGTAR
jgi:hypothetical protein